jgi:hypothetical protein
MQAAARIVRNTPESRRSTCVPHITGTERPLPHGIPRLAEIVLTDF